MKKMLLIALMVSLLTGCNVSNDEVLFEAIRSKNVKSVQDILAKGNIILDPPQQPNQ